LRFSSEYRTERLTLRRPTAADVDDVFAIHSDPRVWEHSPESVHVDRAQSQTWLAHWVHHWRQHGFGYWLADSDGELVGCGGVELLRPGVLNVYYRFRPEAWGKGLASELVAAAVELTAPGMLLLARIRPGNEASARVALRGGFQRRADLDHDGFEVYARARE
jgi:[ribosomal protein S5]-alanine N-acetyltransferase